MAACKECTYRCWSTYPERNRANVNRNTVVKISPAICIQDWYKHTNSCGEDDGDLSR